MSKWYLITGRVIGDHEDTCHVLYQPNEEEARTLFIEMLREESGYEEFEDAEIIINVVAESEAAICVTQEVQ